MPKFDKPDSPNIIWGVNALEGDLTRPDDNYIQTGWTQVKPPYEYENYSMNKLYQGFAYYNQLGFPEWDSVTEYQNGKSYVQGSNNRVYKCIQTHTNKNPTTSGNEAYWELFEGNRQATTTSRGTVELATSEEASEGTSGNLALTPQSITGIFQMLFPVGSTVGRPVDPGETIANGGLGFGTWQKITGRSLIGEGAYTDSRGETKTFTRGGSEGTFKHQLIISEMPSHNHLINLVAASDGGTGTAKGHDTNNITHTKPTQSAGDDSAHNNLHPTFAVPLWYRTA